jgi:hypothetical protein
MTSILFQDFEERSQEVRSYFLFLMILKVKIFLLMMLGMISKRLLLKISKTINLRISY